MSNGKITVETNKSIGQSNLNSIKRMIESKFNKVFEGIDESINPNISGGIILKFDENKIVLTIDNINKLSDKNENLSIESERELTEVEKNNYINYAKKRFVLDDSTKVIYFINDDIIAGAKIRYKDEEIDFVLTHPPYADIIKYSDGKIKDDLSNIHDIDKFCDETEKVAKELFRVLKKGKFCAILMGDTRRNKMYQPLAFKVMERFLKVGFTLKEDIIKRQFNCKATGFWVNKSKDANFLLIMHEHLFIFQKI